ncbi:carbohydrate ABC transporter membrane protein 1, CUT1 family [Streptomyces sp. DconLS]|uniref:ABC transporter permease n=1 Tax=Streptomyces sp. LamerLS-31b TaxID=1839765 RepID=UPI00081DD55D|nr:carbohydrate ABC transporter membrane protein 1, CUT1 family [Streptomyces sp. LamerLS-31b]SCF72922.1 carbohydrate ABC transporter membrane protein 1, CUT1 family [Streptomyces sp. DconLS]
MSLVGQRPGSTPAERPGAAPEAPTAPTRHTVSRWQRVRRDRVLLLMMVPGVLYFVIFQYGALAMNVIAFQHYIPFLGMSHSPWAGVSNFRTLFGDPGFWQAVWHTVSLALFQLVFFIPVPLAVALLLHSVLNGPVRKFVQSVVFLPHFVSWVVAIALIQQMVGPTGVLANLLSGGGDHVVNLFTDPSLFQPMMVAELIWKDCGWATVIFTAALFQVDEQLYESAAMDGAGPWRRLWHVTLPGVRPVVVLVLIMRLGSVFSVGFDQVLLQRDSFGQRVSEVIDTYVYYHATVNGNWSVAAAAGLFKGVVALVLVVAANKVAHRLGEQGVYR